MASLIRQSHATNDTPLWLGTNGGTIGGSLTVNGNITTTPPGLSSVTSGALYVRKVNNGIALDMGYDGSGNGVIVCSAGSSIKFGQVGSAGNTTFTPSAFGANQDNFSIGGVGQMRQLKLLDSGPASVMGTSTLVAGSSPVITTSVCLGPQTYIFLTRTDVGTSTSLGVLRVRQRNAGNFLVESDASTTPGVPDAGDNSSFVWMIVNPV